MKTLQNSDKFHLSAAVGWLEFGNRQEANEELERIALGKTVMKIESGMNWVPVTREIQFTVAVTDGCEAYLRRAVRFPAPRAPTCPGFERPFFELIAGERGK
jgi:hypothetical protein